MICISESDFSLHSIPKDSNFNFKEEMGADISNFLYRVSTPYTLDFQERYLDEEERSHGRIILQSV